MSRPISRAMIDDAMPDTLPAEVLHALDLAQQVVAELRSRDLELRFEVGDGHVRAQLVGGDGAIVCEIPARQGLDVLAGRHVLDQRA